ncbi:MAG: N-6 DNA methylase [Actinobacteria bacterium]|nr:N-6 DNA methylase [Actinomycetota bacterium]
MPQESPPLSEPAGRAVARLAAAGADPAAARARVAAGVARAVAEAMGVDLPPLALLHRWGPPEPIDVPAAQASPALLGVVHESLLHPGQRKATGAHYTPAEVTAAMVGWALEGAGAEHPVVCDPAAGAGAFLLAAADALATRGLSRGDIVRHHLVGAEVDPVAVAVAEAALALWCGGEAVPRLLAADALHLGDGDWPARPDVVVGNPPFLGQLGRATARPPAAAAAARARFGDAARGYADTAALFLVLASRLVRPGGTVALVLPRSFLATRDAGPARRAVLADASLEVLWLPSRPIFAAAVQVCVVVLRRGGSRQGMLRRYRGVPPRLTGAAAVDADVLAGAPTWSHLVVGGAGVPDGEPVGRGTLGEWCDVAAGFRQHYYGVAPFVVDDPDDLLDATAFPPLVTCGLVDPAACWWGHRPARHSRRRWAAPRVDLARLEVETDLGPWARSRLVPKVVVATQTRVVEAAVDVGGRWLPSTPLLTVTAPPERLWHVAAALLSPVVTAWALRHWGGTALSDDALKLGADQVRAVPTPAGEGDWDAAAVALRRASEAGVDAGGEADRRRWLLAAAEASNRAYGMSGRPVVEWWAARLPGRRP